MAVESIGTLEDRYWDRHRVVGRRRQLKKRTQGGGGSRKTLAAASRQMTCSDIPATRKGRSRQGPGRDSVSRGAPRRTKSLETMYAAGMQLENRRPRRKTAAMSRKRDWSQQARQADSLTESREASSRVLHRAAGSEWLDIVEGSASFETKGEVSKAQNSEKNKDDDGARGPAGTRSGNRSGLTALRKVQW
jgi:hypothetical protein